MATLEFLNPVAETEFHHVPPAARVGAGLDGKTVGLFWNMKPGGDVALRVVREKLAERFPGAAFRDYVGSVGSSVRLATPEDQDRMAAECDVVIGTTGDCGGCTSWLIHSMIGLEERGIATASIVARHFLEDAKRSASVLGLAGLPMVVIDHTLNNATEADIRGMLEPAVAGFVAALTEPVLEGAEPTVAPAARETLDGDDLLDCAASYNALLVERGWSDGLPLVPATPESVARMLAGTKLSPDTVVAKALYPGLGVATVEKIAVNGVMAGCRPEHMPVLVALVRAYEGLGILGKTQAISTGPNAPMVLLSGPVVERLGLNFGTCGAGPGSPSHVNTVVGRALRLILMNIGQAYPNVLDMDTIGSPNKYSFCLAENVGANPFQPWNQSKGYAEGDSTLSIACVYPGPDIYDITATRPEELLDTLISMTGSYNGTASAGRWLFGGRGDPTTGQKYREHHVLLLAPVHAALIKSHGWSLDDVQQYLHRGSRIPFRRLGLNIVKPQAAALAAAKPEMSWLLDQPDTLVSIAERPECFEVFVTGGDGGRSQFYYGGSEISTVRIEES